MRAISPPVAAPSARCCVESRGSNTARAQPEAIHEVSEPDAGTKTGALNFLHRCVGYQRFLQEAEREFRQTGEVGADLRRILAVI